MRDVEYGGFAKKTIIPLMFSALFVLYLLSLSLCLSLFASLCLSLCPSLCLSVRPSRPTLSVAHSHSTAIFTSPFPLSLRHIPLPSHHDKPGVPTPWPSILQARPMLVCQQAIKPASDSSNHAHRQQRLSALNFAGLPSSTVLLFSPPLGYAKTVTHCRTERYLSRAHTKKHKNSDYGCWDGKLKPRPAGISVSLGTIGILGHFLFTKSTPYDLKFVHRDLQTSILVTACSICSICSGWPKQKLRHTDCTHRIAPLLFEVSVSLGVFFSQAQTNRSLQSKWTFMRFSSFPGRGYRLRLLSRSRSHQPMTRFRAIGTPRQLLLNNRFHCHLR